MRSLEAVRFGWAGTDGDSSTSMLRPVILVKATTLKLKYLVRRRTFRLLFHRLQPLNHLWYGIQIPDDSAYPCTLWSIAESEEELVCIDRLRQGEKLHVFLFNEEDIQVAAATVEINFVPSGKDARFDGVEAATEGSWREHQDSIEEFLAPGTGITLVEGRPAEFVEWTEIRSALIKRDAGHCKLAMITGDEGEQQEVIAEWLVDVLDGPVAVRNPQVHEHRRPRELSDLLLNHEYGCILLESKAVGILGRKDLPDRSALKKTVLKHLKKAMNQLVGACANICRGLPITDKAGKDVPVARDQPVHCIVLVPELSLVAECEGLVNTLASSLLQDARAFLNILDISELHNLVYNAASVASKSRSLTASWLSMEYSSNDVSLRAAREIPTFVSGCA